MLGTTAGRIFWMFRYLERSENITRLIEAGLRIALTRSNEAESEWASILTTVGAKDAFLERHDRFDGPNVVDFLLRDPANGSSVMSVIGSARNNARQVRPALTREVWESTNDTWLRSSTALERPVADTDLPKVLGLIRQESAIVRGSLHGTMLRNDVYDFARLGTFVERADNTARILDVKYYVLLPSTRHVGSQLDNTQWEGILRSLAAQRSYRWKSGARPDSRGIAEFAILDRRMPRSLAFCYAKIKSNLGYLGDEYGQLTESHELAARLGRCVEDRTIEDIFDEGLHEFLKSCIDDTNTLARQIELDYRFGA